MRKSFALLVLSISILVAGVANGAEGLFFGVSVTSTKKVQKSSQDNLSHSAQVTRTLTSAGYQPKQVNDDVVSFSMDVNELSVPVLVSNAGNGELRVKMLLSFLASGQQVPTAKLLKLLDSNRNDQPAVFTYNEDLRQIELHMTVSAENARGIHLRDQLDVLAEIAVNTETLWNVGKVVSKVDGEQMNLGLQQRSQLTVR
jgi:hypothetical protein